MKILVVGGAGYVGSHCVRRLIAGGHSVTVFDHLKSGHREAVPKAATLIEGDLADCDLLARTLRPGAFEAVLHFAAYLNVGESVHKPLMYWRNNVANTLNLLEAMEHAGVRRMVFSSSCAIYGVPQKLPITEDLPKDPINPYGATKLAMEWLLRDSASAWGLGSVCLRYFNAAGASSDGSIGEDHNPEIHLIPIVLQVALGQRTHVEIYGTDYPTPDGTCVRDYIHVEDLAEAHLAAIEQLKEGEAEAFNVGTGRGQSVRELIDAARRVTGHEIPAKEGPRRPGDPPELYADSSKLRDRYGWQPRFMDINETVASAWRWHSIHPRGFSSS